MVSLAWKWCKEGLTIGWAKSFGQGLCEGLVRAVLSVYRERFGVVPRTLNRRLQTASPDELADWVRRVATVSTVDEVLWYGEVLGCSGLPPSVVPD